MRIVGLCGSLRRESYNRTLLSLAHQRLPAGVELVEFDRLRDIPAYDSDLEENGRPAPDAVAALRGAMRGADAVLIATPEYNSSIPGALKNALDWASRPAGECSLMGTPAAVIGVSTGMFGAAWAQAELRKVLRALGARVIDVELPIPNATHICDGGRLQLNQQQAQILDELLAELVGAVEVRAEALR
jgi:chromate reductase